MICQSRHVTNSYDQDLRRRVVNYLVGRNVPNLRQIHVEARGGTVILRGRVRCFYHKQLCIHCSRRVAGVMKLIDRIEVV